MVLKGVDEINWFTDRPNRVEGKWKPGKLLRKWNSYFANSGPNAQVTLKADDEQEMVTFEMFKTKIKKGKMIFNIKSISDSGEDLITGLKNKELGDISLFIDEALEDSGLPSCFPYCSGAKLNGINLSNQSLFTDFSNADLTDANLTFAKLKGVDLISVNLSGAKLKDAVLRGAELSKANLSGANLDGADLNNANLDGAAYNSDAI